ncbi:hypothetical protein [Lysobacter sp. Root494]|uniref:hypothetical protein n=1 Tax=Lysobacter sp. Root494 TaxID=1736549 RepID=UPI0012F78FE3|nr:hypothetical protein [Lysobacter sp. Root494]
MELKIFLGLGVDLTLFGGRDPATEALEALLDAAGEQLSAHLWPTILAHGSPLRQVHATCGVYDTTDTRAARARLRRQGEQLEVELTVDWRPWFDRPVVDQAAFVVEHMIEAIANALEHKQQRTLADACRAFRPAFDLDAALAARQAWLADWDPEPQATVALTADSDGRVRQVQPLTRRRGTLWLMLRQPADLDGTGTNELLDRIEAFALENGIGRSDGRSFGAGGVDLSFKVTNLLEAGTRLDEYLRDRFPACEYVISDDFEVAFQARAKARTNATGPARG